jgi:hypothetical protein
VFRQHLVSVELFRPGQRFRLGDSFTEPIPGQNRRDCIKGIPLGLACGNQRSTDTGIQTNLLVDRTAISLEGSRMSALSLAEHRPDQSVEQVDSLVCQACGQIEGYSDQSGVTALAFVFSNVLRCGTARLAGKPNKASLMNAVAACSIEVDRVDMLQALNQAEHHDRLRRLRHLAQPGEPALTGLRPALRQRIESLPLLSRQPIGQPTLDLASRPITGLDAEPLERPWRWEDDAPTTAFLHCQIRQMSQSVILNGVPLQPACQLCSGPRAEGTTTKSGLKLCRVTAAVLL